jgi:membrane protein implicated in regulation of membrane protease activity
MSLDFLSGLLLTTVVAATVVYVIKELIGGRSAEQKKTRNVLASAMELMPRGEAEPVNEHLVGSIGKVISHSSDSDRPMRVRLGRESWPARLQATDGAALPVGAAVEVVAVDGAVVAVRASDDVAGAPSGG